MHLATRDISTIKSGLIQAVKSPSKHLRAGAGRALEELVKNRHKGDNRERWNQHGQSLMAAVLPDMLKMLKDENRMARIASARFFSSFFRGGVDIMGDDRDTWRAKIGNELLKVGTEEPDPRVCEAIIGAVTSHGVIEKCDPDLRNKQLAALVNIQPYPNGSGSAVKAIERLIKQKQAHIDDFAPALIKLCNTECTQNTMFMPGGRTTAVQLMVDHKRWEILPALGKLITETYIYRDPGLHWGRDKYETYWKVIETLDKPQFKVIEKEVKAIVERLKELNTLLKAKQRFDKRQYEERQKFLERLETAVRRNA